jgi:hypothetical protein
MLLAQLPHWRHENLDELQTQTSSWKLRCVSCSNFLTDDMKTEWVSQPNFLRNNSDLKLHDPRGWTLYFFIENTRGHFFLPSWWPLNLQHLPHSLESEQKYCMTPKEIFADVISPTCMSCQARLRKVGCTCIETWVKLERTPLLDLWREMAEPHCSGLG